MYNKFWLQNLVAKGFEMKTHGVQNWTALDPDGYLGPCANLFCSNPNGRGQAAVAVDGTAVVAGRDPRVCVVAVGVANDHCTIVSQSVGIGAFKAKLEGLGRGRGGVANRSSFHRVRR